MVNRPKDKGTFAESAVAEYLRGNGWPHAERRALAGAVDKGDITGTPGLAWEVKYSGTKLRMGEWVGEMVTERANCHATHGVLVIKPAGRGVKKIADWLAVMVDWDFTELWRSCQVSGGLLHTRAPEGYTESKLKDQLFAVTASAMPEEYPVLTLRPRGMREQPENWYRVMTLQTAVRMLRTAGYGTAL